MRHGRSRSTGQQVDERRLSELNPAPLSRAERRIVLAMLVGLFAFIGAFDLGRADFAERWVDWGAVWMGSVLLAQPYLLAIWAAMAWRPLLVRWPQALGLAALLGLAGAWGDRSYPTPSMLPLVLRLLLTVVPVVLLTGILAIFRKR